MMIPAFRTSIAFRAAAWCCAASVLLILSGCTSHEVTVTIKSVEGAKKADADVPDEKSAAPAGYGNLVGKVTYTSDAPSAPLVVVKGSPTVKDAAVCAAASIPDESLVVNSTTKGIANVVIYLERPKAIKPELKTPPSTPAVFDQRGCRFFPHMLLVRVGQPVRIMSDDAVAHNTHTFPNRNTTFNSAIPANERKGIDFKYTKGENNPIEVKCDLHSWMKGYHFPVDHPYAAITDADGKFQIAGLPAGKHSFKVWQERAQFLERKLEVTIEVDKDAPLELKYSEAQFK